MDHFEYKNKKYRVDSQGYLIDAEDWDESFAEGIAPHLKITDGLKERHWQVIYFIRDTFHKIKTFPLIYDVCHSNNISLKEMKALFPTGYHRGAIKIAGINCRRGMYQDIAVSMEEEKEPIHRKVYQVDVYGFLVNPEEWDENYAIHKARELKILDELSDKHWQIIYYLRKIFKESGTMPTVYQACEDNRIELDELERLFPDGYHRGAVKIAGLWYNSEE
jgi:tRNA 2-thiouridine synthesizing protein E